MIRNFSPKTMEALGYYVYVYSDPDTKKPFYVGKGKGNRAFQHLDDQSENDKVRKIAEIKARGKEPLIEILVHGLNEETALKVEAAAIDLIGIDHLTNQQRGHDSSTYGKIEVSMLEARYVCKKLSLEDIGMSIRNRQIKLNMLFLYTMVWSLRYINRCSGFQVFQHLLQGRNLLRRKDVNRGMSLLEKLRMQM